MHKASHRSTKDILVGTHRVHFEEVGSTNAEARKFAEGGAASGTVITADYQTSGRGRFGRQWVGDRGLNLFLSVILRPDIAAPELGVLTVAGAVAVAATVESYCGVPRSVTINWPNDVLLNGRKCSGMLLEAAQMAGSSHRPEYVVLGIGINVNQERFPADLQTRATSLWLENGRHVNRRDLLDTLIVELDRRYRDAHRNRASLVHDFDSRLAGKGTTVEYSTVPGPGGFTGTIVGTSDDGGLIVETGAGRTTIIRSGEVTSSGQYNREDTS